MLPQVRKAIKSLRGVDYVETPRTVSSQSKAKAQENVREALEQLKLYKEGKMTFRPAEALLEEL